MFTFSQQFLFNGDYISTNTDRQVCWSSPLASDLHRLQTPHNNSLHTSTSQKISLGHYSIIASRGQDSLIKRMELSSQVSKNSMEEGRGHAPVLTAGNRDSLI